MQISFIYIKEYKNIEEQRFNLDGMYSYEFFSAEGRIVYKKTHITLINIMILMKHRDRLRS